MTFSTAKNYFIFLKRGSQVKPAKFKKKENTMGKSSDLHYENIMYYL